jgi:hypothetical protein
MIEVINDVYNWLDVANVPTPSVERIQEWVNSEIEEFKEALPDDNDDERADAIADAIVFLLNLGYFYDVHPKRLDKRMKQVLQSNWTKYAKTEQEAIDTVEAYRTSTHWNKPNVSIQTDYKKELVDGKEVFIIKDSNTGKILKALGFIDSQNIEL